MGGRGSSSGVSDDGKLYGTEYRSVYDTGNIKFLIKNEGSPTPPLETMTQGRVYTTLNSKGNPGWVTYYDKKNKRYKTLDLHQWHRINGKPVRPHAHNGYYHDGEGRYLSYKESQMVDRVNRTWKNRRR